jgi:hypothetical protein
VEEIIRSKNIHVKLSRLTHSGFKSSLAQLGLSMQEAFEQFAMCIAAGDKSAVRLLDRMKKQRVRDELAKVGLKPGLGRMRRVLDELDPNTLYDLINEEETADEAALPTQT